MPTGSRGWSKAVLIAGPTASGKSAFALELAQKSGGVVINTDSMQVYRDLRVITARPTPAEEARVPHRLYGHVDAAVNFSAGAWVMDAAKVLAEARAQNLQPIFSGVAVSLKKKLTQPLVSELHILQADGSMAKTLRFKMLPALQNAVAVN